MLRNRQPLWSWLNGRTMNRSENDQPPTPSSEFPPLEDNPWLSLHTSAATRQTHSDLPDPAPPVASRATYAQWLSEESSPYGFSDEDGTIKQVDSRNWRRVATPSRGRRFIATPSNANRQTGVKRKTLATSAGGSTWLLQGAFALALVGIGWYAEQAHGHLAKQVSGIYQRAFADDYSPRLLAAIDRFASEHDISLSVWNPSVALKYHVPVSGTVVEEYSTNHPQITIQGHAGETVLAAGSGTVARVTHMSSGYLLVVDHGGGRSTLYDGLASVSVHEGEAVSAGETIGRLAKSGKPVMHFGFEQDGQFVNPNDYIVWSSARQ
jgi:murein DD-endopeptidase MepM/ murein hydrolase activator NlpD